jgi:hypothetical protein
MMASNAGPWLDMVSVLLGENRSFRNMKADDQSFAISIDHACCI